MSRVGQVTRREWSWVLITVTCIVALASLPYLLAWLITPPGYHYSGLLINPLDGHSYLAKMGQGAAGSWKFRLPYSSEFHEPVLIFTQFLTLGHLVPGGSPTRLLLLYHVTRVIAGLALLTIVYKVASLLTDEIQLRRLIMLFVGLSSGLGWLTGTAPDLSVPEAITFPSLLINAHFGLTFLLMLLLIFGIALGADRRTWWVLIPVCGAWLTMIQPYAVLVVGLSTAAWVLLRWVKVRQWPILSLSRLVLFSLSALPFLIYFVWMTRNNPLISAWMGQNITPSPPFWQWLLGFGFLGPLAVAGIWHLSRRPGQSISLLLCWLGAQLALMLIPIALQRRLSTGLHLPVAILAAIGWDQVLKKRSSVRRFWLLTACLLLILFPSNLIMMFAGVNAVGDRNPLLVQSDAQWQTMTWLRENIPAETVVLADKDLSALVPAWGGGARVVYGHPFETVDAERKLAAVERFYAGEMTIEEQVDFLDRFAVDFVILQESDLALPAHLKPVWQQEPITVFQVEGH